MDYEKIIAQKDERIKQLEAELARIYKLIKGSKSERFIPDAVAANQQSLFEGNLMEEDATKGEVTEENEETEIISYERKKRKKHNGRNAIPEHLPVKEVVIEPEEDTTGLVKIGEQRTETLEYTQASLVKIITIRPKYAKPDNGGVIIGKLPDRPIPKSIAEPSLLSHIFVSKFIDHLPYYRQIQQFKRDFDWELSKSTVNDWFIQISVLLEPLYNKLKEKILGSGYVQADESPIKVLDTEKKKDTHQGYMWLYHSPEEKAVLFNYRKGRGQHGPKEFLNGYKGYVQVDGYKVYDAIERMYSDIKLVGCLAHIRRKYFEAKDEYPKEATYVLNLIAKIYKAERKYHEENLTVEQITEKRKKEMQPLLDEWKEWVDEKALTVLPKSLLGKALSYTINQWKKLEPIAKDGRLKLDNNLIENSVRPLALGRKNYLFAGSHAGANRNAMMYSFFATCKKNDVNPRAWMTDVLKRIPSQNIQDLEELLPANWKSSEV